MDHATAVAETRRALLGVVAAIMQTPDLQNDKSLLVPKMAVGKATAALTTSAIYGLVSTFGTAGTGAAIGGLSGAAAHNATMAWLGNALGAGFGMAGGAILLPALGFLASFFVVKSLFSKKQDPPRKLEQLNPDETEVVFCALTLLQPLNELSSEGADEIDPEYFRIFVQDGIKPLCERIERGLPAKMSTQTGTATHRSEGQGSKFRNQLRACSQTLLAVVQEFPHVVRPADPAKKVSWFQKLRRTVLGRHSKERHETCIASATLASTFHCLLHEQPVVLRAEQMLVIDALRLRDKSLSGASPRELSDFVKQLTTEELRMAVIDTKRNLLGRLLKKGLRPKGGKAFQEQLCRAAAPGIDVEFVWDGRSIRSVSINDTGSSAIIHEHLFRRQNHIIPLSEQMATVVEATGNPQLRFAIINQTFFHRAQQLNKEGVLSKVTDDLLKSEFMHAGFVAYQCLSTPSAKKLDYRNLIEKAAIGFSLDTAADGAAEFLPD